MFKFSKVCATLAGAAALVVSGGASATLTPFQTFTGNIGYSSDGVGFSGTSGVITASVPVGSTVLAAYLYTTTSNGPPSFANLGSFEGNSISYTALPTNSDACCNLTAGRADVTSIVAAKVNGGAGGIYSFNVTEGNTDLQDGEALFVIYRNAALPESTFGLLDGNATTAGDTTSINFASGLNPAQAGFRAEMVLGIGYSFSAGGQVSTVTVNGQTLTTVAGNFDDGVGANGGLVTVGGYDDPFTAVGETDYTKDNERYDLKSLITAGDTTIKVDTFNSSADDNIFVAGFFVTGRAGINEPPPPIPEPSTYALMGLGLGVLAWRKRRAARKT